MPSLPHRDQIDQSHLETLSECPWCRSEARIKLFVENGFDYVQCLACKLIYLGTRLKEDFVSRIYDSNSYHGAASAEWTLRVGQKRLALLGRLDRSLRIHEDGCGAGGFAAACRDAGHEITASDVGSDAAQRARTLFGVEVRAGSLAAMAIPDSSLDVVASFNLLSHLYRPWEYMREVARVLAPNGTWLFRTGDRSGRMRNVRRGQWSAPEHVFHYPIGVLADMMSTAGLRLVRTAPAFDSDYPYFLFDYSRSAIGFRKRVAQRLCSASVLAWTLLHLPKDDIYGFAAHR